jgi:hypothetical protein
MKINWHFDEEEWDPYTLLGEISITGDHETAISDDCTILDRWLVGISEGLRSLSKGEPIDVDLVDEPDPLCFGANGNKYEIHYKNMVVSFSDLTQAIEELKETVRMFLQALLQHPEPRSKIVIEELNVILQQKYELQKNNG